MIFGADAGLTDMRKTSPFFARPFTAPIKSDASAIATPGPKQAWFRGPAGNILSVLEDQA